MLFKMLFTSQRCSSHLSHDYDDGVKYKELAPLYAEEGVCHFAQKGSTGKYD